MTVSILLLALVRLLIAIGLGWAVLGVYRWLRTQSRPLSLIVAAAILLRLVVGGAMFWTSYLALPFAEAWQRGNGFWTIALDATGYFEMATTAAERWSLYPMDHSVPSPFFVDALAVWMMALGSSPAVAMLMNLSFYLALVVLLVRCYRPSGQWRDDLPAVVAVTAYSFAPVILIHSTQPLKEELSSVLMGLACLAILRLAPVVSRAERGIQWGALMAATLVLAGVVFGVAGIRWYLAVILWPALALTFGVIVVRHRFRHLRRLAVLGLIPLGATGLAFLAGAGPYGRVITDNLRYRELQGIWRDTANMTELSRVGFLMSGGATNVVVAVHDDVAAGKARQEEFVRNQQFTYTYKEEEARQRREVTVRNNTPRTGATPRRGSGPPPDSYPGPTPEIKAERDAAALAVATTMRQRIQLLVVGVALFFLPTFVLDAALGIAVPSGRGLLAVADVDSLFLNASLIALIALGWQRRHLMRRRLPFVVFCATTAAVTVVLVGYVVTNYGTLWRMRPMAMVPLWLIALALSPGRADND